ncbi:MAG: hypothetical protein JNM17_27975 [Archangium sp.]|nr:hypothetical protein [Archangium sp.]
MRAAIAVFLVWLYAGDLVRFIKVQSAPVALINAVPSLALSLIGTALAFAFTAIVLLDVGGRLQPDWRPRSLVHAAVAALVFIDFSIISSRLTPILPEVRVAAVIQGLADAASEAATLDQIPTDRRAFEEWARESGGPAPLFKEGNAVGTWHVEVRENCIGPAEFAGNSPAGTLIYCVAPNRRRAWITAVAIPLGKRFGQADIISTQGAFVGDVEVISEPRRRNEQPVWDPPTP